MEEWYKAKLMNTDLLIGSTYGLRHQRASTAGQTGPPTAGHPRVSVESIRISSLSPAGFGEFARAPVISGLEEVSMADGASLSALSGERIATAGPGVAVTISPAAQKPRPPPGEQSDRA